MDPPVDVPLDDLIAARGELRVTTDNSVWFLRPTEYCRLPLHERGPRNDYSIDGALEDGVWHQHQGIWVRRVGRELAIRILPAGRPQGLHGIVTGNVRVVRAAGPPIDLTDQFGADE